MKSKFFFLAFLMVAIFSSLGNAQVVVFEENFNNFTGWGPAPENGAGCEWTAENGWAKIKTMGYNPNGHIYAVYEKNLPKSISPDEDFSFKAYIRCQDGDPSGATSYTYIKLVTPNNETVAMVMWDDSQSASGYGGLTYIYEDGKIYDNDPSGFGRNNPTIDNELEIRREGSNWTAYLDGKQLGSSVKFSGTRTAAKVQICQNKYKNYSTRDGRIDYIKISGNNGDYSCLYVVNDPDPTVSSILGELGINLTHSTTIPSDLSSYDLVICCEYSACTPSTAPYVGNYVKNGGGAILVGGTPSTFGGGGYSCSNISDWFGTSQYSNVGVSDAKVQTDNPLGTSLHKNDVIDHCTGWGGAAVSNVASDVTILVKWDYGSDNIFSFIRSYQNGRVAFWAGSSSYNSKTIDLIKAVCQWTAGFNHIVSTPNTPTGPTSGTVGQSLTFSTGGSTCNQGHSIQYRFDWGNGSYSSWGSSLQSYSYSAAGTYTVKAQTRCSVDNSVVSSWSGGKSVTITSSHTVSTPTTPNGPSSGIVNQSLSFSTGGSTCNQGHSVQYRFDWGNGNYSSWGSSSQTYSWSIAGTYTVKAQARCSLNNEVVSSWSGGKTVAIATVVDIPITPSTAATQQAGTEFDVEIIVGSASKPVTNLYGVSFELGYSTTYIDYVSYDKTGSFLGTDLIDYVTPDDPNGKVAVGITRKSTTVGVNGYGSVIKIKFRSLPSTPGNTQVSFAIHNATANDPNGNPIGLSPGSLTITITSGMAVWPGDTNNDRIVNQADVLPLGIYWNKTGPKRTCHANETQWIAHTASRWTPEAATYADANGDGVVNQADVLVIGLNWGKTHTLLKPFADNDQRGSGVVSGLLVSKLCYNKEQKEIYYEIHAEKTQELFGIAFEVCYSQKDLKPMLIESGNLFGQNPLFIYKEQPDVGSIGIGLSHKADQSILAENGELARITFKLLSDEKYIQGNAIKIDCIQANDKTGQQLNVATRPCADLDLFDSAITQVDNYKLNPNYPNPFNPTTAISFTLPQAVHVQIQIFDLTGRLVKTVLNAEQQSGIHTVIWDAHDENGRGVANGMYLCRMIAGEVVQHQKMILAK